MLPMKIEHPVLSCIVAGCPCLYKSGKFVEILYIGTVMG